MCQHTDAQYVLLFLVLAANSDQFRILRSYMLLLHPLILMRSCPEPQNMEPKYLVWLNKFQGPCATYTLIVSEIRTTKKGSLSLTHTHTLSLSLSHTYTHY